MITTVGEHKVKHGDVMNGIDDLMSGETADLIYSDPPWGNANLSYWQTMRSKMDKVERQEATDLNSFLNQIFGIAKKYGKGPMLLEYGQKWADEIIERGKQFGFQHYGIVETQYKSGSKLLPMDIHVFSKGPLNINMDEFKREVAGTYGYETLKKAVPFFAKPGGILLDPCCGMGYSAKAAIDNGMCFRGNELNATRLQKTIKRLN